MFALELRVFFARREAIVAVFCFCMEKGFEWCGNLLHGGSFVIFHRTVHRVHKSELFFGQTMYVYHVNNRKPYHIPHVLVPESHPLYRWR